MHTYYAPRRGKKIAPAQSIAALAAVSRAPRLIDRILTLGLSGGAPTSIREVIDQLIELRKQKKSEVEELLAKPKEEKRNLNAEEAEAFGKLTEEMKEFDERIAELEDQEKRDQAIEEVRKRFPSIKVTREPLTYGRGSRNSFFADVFMASIRGDREAQERLVCHGKEQQEELDRRAAAADRAADELRERGVFSHRDRDIEFEKRDLNRTDGTGGGFVPPLHLVDEYVALARAARVTADLFNVRPLPPGTDSINIPRVTGGTATGIQTADNAAVTETDLTEATLSVPVRTIAGQQDVAIQLLEQSPIAFDEVVFADLIADYNSQLDSQVINGSGSSGQILGIRNVSGINAVTYTDATPTVPELYPKIADGIQQVATDRKLPPTVVLMHPRRWFWHTAALDSQNRPLVVPLAQGPMNTFGRTEDVQGQGPVGVLQGLPVFIDPNVPINLGAGTNEDVILISRFLDHWLWESMLRTRVLPEVGSGTLTVRLQVYAYAAATAGRYPDATATVSGTGLITPTF